MEYGPAQRKAFIEQCCYTPLTSPFPARILNL
jgi:hypothetical protein